MSLTLDTFYSIFPYNSKLPHGRSRSKGSTLRNSNSTTLELLSYTKHKGGHWLDSIFSIWYCVLSLLLPASPTSIASKWVAPTLVSKCMQNTGLNCLNGTEWRTPGLVSAQHFTAKWCKCRQKWALCPIKPVPWSEIQREKSVFVNFSKSDAKLVRVNVLFCGKHQSYTFW